MKITTTCNTITAFERDYGVAAAFQGRTVRVIASTAARVPGDSSVLGAAGMTTIARSGSSGWGPPS